jgi:hypothetical protein
VRIAGILFSAVLAAAVIAQGAYINKTRKQMDALYDQVQQLAAESTSDGETPVDRSARGVGGGGRPAPATAIRLPVPRFVPGPAPSSPAPAGALPLPPTLDSQEARDQLRQFVAAELQRERDEQRDRFRQRFEEDQQRRREAMVKALGLNDEQGKKLTDVLTAAQNARRDMRDKIQSGAISRADIGKQMTALRESTDQQVRQVIGDDHMQKYQELQRQDQPRGGFGGGGRGRGGGPPGEGPPAGRPPGGP